MTTPARPPRAPSSIAGLALAVGAIGGVLVGNHFGQASAGLVIGLAIAVLVSLAAWWTGRG